MFVAKCAIFLTIFPHSPYDFPHMTWCEFYADGTEVKSKRRRTGGMEVVVIPPLPHMTWHCQVDTTKTLFILIIFSGPLTDRQISCLSNGLNGMELEAFKCSDVQHPGAHVILQEMFPYLNSKTIDVVASCLRYVTFARIFNVIFGKQEKKILPLLVFRMDPQERPKSDQLLTVAYFTWDNFPQKFIPELTKKIAIEAERRPKLHKVPCPPPSKEGSSKFNISWKVRSA